MTTVHHTAIATGAAANASTFNTPLGSLDAAIVGLDTTLDNLIISSGTSDAETIAARGGYNVLDGRLDDLGLRNNVLLVDATFAVTNTAAKRFKTITLALAQCVGGETVMIAPGTYTEAITISDPNITLLGSGMPAYDEATGRLVGGTIIRGRILTGTVTGLVIMNLGVDLADYPTTVWDCIGATNAAFRADRAFINLALRGNGDMTGAARSHGLYIVGSNTFVSNVKVFQNYHGIAIHGQHVSMNNIYMFACYGTSLVIKAKNGFDVFDVNVSNLQIEGSTTITNGRAGPLEIQNADASNTYDVNITNVVADYCVLGAFQVYLGEGTGSVHDISVSNMIARHSLNNAALGDYRIKEVANLTLNNCQSWSRGSGNAFQIDDTPTISGVRVMNGAADGVPYRNSDANLYDVLEMNGKYWRKEGVGLALNNVSGFLQSVIGGYGGLALLSVTAANTAIATLYAANSGQSEYSGLVMVFARSGSATANNSASYVLLVHKHYNSSNNSCVSMAIGGQTAGSAATSPSFTFTLDGANNQLKATPVASTSGTFYFVFTTIGNIKAVAL